MLLNLKTKKMFRTHIVPVVLGITLALLYKRLFWDTNNDKAISQGKYENTIAQRIKETRDRWRWIFENRRSSERVQQLVEILHKLGMTTDEFIETAPKIKYQLSAEINKNWNTDDAVYDHFTADEAIETMKQANFFVKDISQLRGMVAILRLKEGNIRGSDAEWIRSLEAKQD